MMDLIQTRKRNKPHLNKNPIELQKPYNPITTANENNMEACDRTTKPSMVSSISPEPGTRQRQFRRHQLTGTTSNRIHRILIGAIILTLICVLFNPMAEQRSEARKIKDKKVLKSLVKGLIFKNLSTKKNFLPLPVPIPVPIELNEPPVYLKGKPRYVTIYKRTPVIKPTPAPVYHMPIYPPSYGYMMDPYPLYDNLMYAGSPASYQNYPTAATSGSANQQKGASGNSAYETSPSSSSPSAPAASSTGSSTVDFDDDYDNIYAASNRKAAAAVAAAAAAVANRDRRLAYDYNLIIRRADSGSRQVNKMRNSISGGWLRPTDEQESIDSDDSRTHSRRFKRQAVYESNYENEPPCYGFPLTVNIKSRIKMDQLFPIHGNSQFKKCIKVGRPLLPPVENKPPYIHVFTLNKPY